MKMLNSPNQVETFMLKHGEAIVDTLGAEVDRIEQNLKVTHCYLILGNIISILVFQ